MSKVPEFHSVNEVMKIAELRVHHNNNACPSGRDIPQQERRSGVGGYALCKECQNLPYEMVPKNPEGG